MVLSQLARKPRSRRYSGIIVPAESANEITDEQIDAMTAHPWFAHYFGAGMNGLGFALKCEIADTAMRGREELTQ